VFVPLAAPQGPRMTVDFDARMITDLCNAISEKLETFHHTQTLVMPTLPFGATPEYSGFGHGYV
jgi:creatinine amidohydrolase/Fe(II)-dependent formamide hydrolase-like protein